MYVVRVVACWSQVSSRLALVMQSCTPYGSVAKTLALIDGSSSENLSARIESRLHGDESRQQNYPSQYQASSEEILNVVAMTSPGRAFLTEAASNGHRSFL